MEGDGSVSGSRGKLRRPASRKGGAGKKALGVAGNERTVRGLRLSKALTLPDSTTVADACRRMTSRRVDACLLTGANSMLCGIMTDRDLALKCVGEGLDVNTTLASQIMTRNPTFVNVDSSAVAALQMMVKGKFRHLPVIENGEVVALLNITRCLYDAIARMERAVEKGQAIAAAIEGVESHFGGAASGFMETFRDKFFRPTLLSIIQKEPKPVAFMTKGETVQAAAQRMKQLRASSAIVTNGITQKPIGILTTKDILSRVLALNLRPEETLVEKVMTPNPECAKEDMSIVDALHTMHDGKFLHLPVVDTDGNCTACVDVVVLANGALTTAAGTGAESGESTNQLMQRFWDSALALEPPETDDDVTSVRSGDVGDLTAVRNTRSQDDARFLFKMPDRMGRSHRFHCASDSLTELVCAIASRLGGDFDPDDPPSIMYEDEDGEKVVISVDEDLSAAVKFARASGQKALKLILDFHDDDGGLQHLAHAQHKSVPQHKSSKYPPPRPQKSMPGKGAHYKQSRPPQPNKHHDEEEYSRYERTLQFYSWALLGLTVVTVASVGVTLYLQRNK